MRQRREIEVFSLSFLDLLSCGLGSMMLLFVLAAMIVERQGTLDLAEKQRAVAKTQEDVERLQREIDLLERTQADAERLIAEPAPTDAEVSTSLANVAELQQEVDDLRSRIGEPSEPRGPGPRIPRDPSVLVLLDASGSMLGETQEEVLELRRTEGQGTKWPRAQAFIGEVLEQNLGCEIFVCTFGERVMKLSQDWATSSESENERMRATLATLAPHGGSDLVGALHSLADVIGKRPSARVYLITDALPNLPREGSGARVSPDQRLRNLKLARQAVIDAGFGAARWVVVLLPWQDDPDAAERYGQDFLGRESGSVICLPKTRP